MEVILIERISRLGNIGDVVRVKDGYGRHFLLPRQKALRATPENRKRIEEDRASLEAKNTAAEADAKTQAQAIEARVFVSIRQASESGQLYGSVRGQDIAGILSEAGIAITRAQIILSAPIKHLGMHPVRLRLHADVIARITLNVARSADEAERQEKGIVEPQKKETPKETREDSDENTDEATPDTSDEDENTPEKTPENTSE